MWQNNIRVFQSAEICFTIQFLLVLYIGPDFRTYGIYWHIGTGKLCQNIQNFPSFTVGINSPKGALVTDIVILRRHDIQTNDTQHNNINDFGCRD
jgi:hypothetical protein